MRTRWILAGILGAGLAFRLVLALWVFPGQGYAGDINAFVAWANGIAEYGPSAFYSNVSSANYPPVAIGVIWAMEALSHPLAALAGASSAHLLLVLLKLPAVLADIATAAVLYVLGRDYRSARTGLIAAALFVLAPPVWYVSALWGQIDSLLTFFSVLALALLVKDRTYGAALAAVAALMVKPQGILVVLVVGVVLLATLLRRDASGRRRIGRLLGTVGAAVGFGLVLLVPFDYEQLAGGWVAGIPVLGDLVGFFNQSVGTGGLFPVLTANTYNPWALVGGPSLAATIGTGTSAWQLDTLTVLGLPAFTVGLVLFGMVVVAVVAGLVHRPDLLGVLLGYTVLSFAFCILPTRVHERYLAPVFATAAVLAAPALWRIVVYLVAALLHLINLHAVLAAGLGWVVQGADSSPSGSGGRSGGGGPGGSGGPGGGGPGGSEDGSRATQIELPLSGLVRAEWMVYLVSIAQLLLLVGLLVLWGYVVIRLPEDTAPGADRAEPAEPSAQLTEARRSSS